MTTTASPSNSTHHVDTSRVLVVADEVGTSEPIRVALESAGHVVSVAQPGPEALQSLDNGPDVVVADVDTGQAGGLEFVIAMRADPRSRSIPLIFLTPSADADAAVRALTLGADDYLRTPIQTAALVARVRAKLERPSAPVHQLVRHPGTALLTEGRFDEELAREIGRATRTGRVGCLAALDLAEREVVAKRLGSRADHDLRVQVSALAATGAGEFDLLSRDEDGRLLVLMPDTDATQARARLARLTEHVVRGAFTADGAPVHVTPVVGFSVFGEDGIDAERMMRRTVVATSVATSHLDLQPVEWTPQYEIAEQEPKGQWWAKLRRNLRTPLQVFITFDIGVVLPFITYVLLYRAGFNVAPVVFLGVVAALVLTATLIWVESFLALDPGRPPAVPPGPHPPASAIIAAYLPNEAATVVQTIEAFLRMDYPGDLQIVLAYNTPQAMPVENSFAQIAARDPRFVPFRVEGSTSKAQNINAALGQLTGEFVGVFDADHHPDPDSFRRAWRWIAAGNDVVQGHCVIRNGDSSWVARTVAVEFETIYAVSHPGRSRLHTFGIFGGSNGYWRTDLLRRVRMQGSMLTEDIDSSLRVVEAGGRIASDPALVSRELAPNTFTDLWNQRMRWAQGWFQVSRKHLRLGWQSPNLTLRQKVGFAFLLGWREVYPWISLQVLPLLAFFAWRAGGVAQLDVLVPFFVLTTLFTLSVGPAQTYFAYRLAVPELRRRRLWFLAHLVISSLVYTEMKNVIGRVAQIKELTGDRQWKVTPRLPDTRSRSGSRDTHAPDPATDLDLDLRDPQATRPVADTADV